MVRRSVLVVVTVAALVANPDVRAAEPASGSLSLQAPSLTFTGHVAAPGTACPSPGCDEFALDVDVPAGHAGRHDAALTITVEWDEPEANLDVFICPDVIEASQCHLAWDTAAAWSVAPSGTSETVTLRDPLPMAYRIVVVATAGDAGYRASLSLTSTPLARVHQADCPAYSRAAYDTGGPARDAEPDDPMRPAQWGLDLVRADDARARGARGGRALVAVVDSGVDFTHPDLLGQLRGGVDLVATPADDCPEEVALHGSAVSGVIAARTDNGFGVASVAPDAKILPVRILDARNSYTMPRAAKGIFYAAAHGADVINLSIFIAAPGAEQVPFYGFLAMHAAARYAWERGAVVVAISGNNHSYPLCSEPALAPQALCVGSVDRRGLPSRFSSMPNKEGSLGFRAPGGAGTTNHGVQVLLPATRNELACGEEVLVLRAPLELGCGGLRGFHYGFGTSFAAPHVSGVAALLVGMGCTNEQVLQRLKQTSYNPVSGARGAWDPVYGWGIVDAAAATADPCG